MDAAMDAAFKAAPGAFRRAALAGLLETFLASAIAIAAMVPLVRFLAASLTSLMPPAFWGPFSAFPPYAPAVGLLGIAASLSRVYLAPYLLGAACAILALAAWRAFG
jgi:hypothetical protein